MLKIIAFIVELIAAVFALWLISCLSCLFHEFGHAVGYMLATGDRHWHIRVGWGKCLLETKRLAVNLLVFDGLFTPANRTFETKGKLITTLLGGPVFSLLLAAGLAVMKFGGLPLPAGFLAESAAAIFLNAAFAINLWILVLSVAPIRYFYGEVRGLETDGLQILHALMGRGK